MARDDEKRLKMAIIAGASHALEYLKKHPRSEHEEILQHISMQSEEILNKIDDPL